MTLAVALATAGGCGGDSGGAGTPAGSGGTDPGETPDDVAGDYLVALTNHENTCPNTNSSWTEGAMNEGVPFSITQNGTKLTAETMGASAIAFLLITGNNTFRGEIHGSHFVLTSTGTKTEMYGDCTYTVDAIVEGDVAGDAISGTLTYKPIVSDSPSCADYDCAAEQAFSGSRPPK